MATTIVNLYDRVVALLEKNPHLRDSDEKLAANIWLNDIGGTSEVNNLSAMQFLTIFSEGKRLTSLESIGRARRKAQENRSDLRGDIYYSRQHKQEEWKEAMRNITK